MLLHKHITCLTSQLLLLYKVSLTVCFRERLVFVEKMFLLFTYLINVMILQFALRNDLVSDYESHVSYSNCFF